MKQEDKIEQHYYWSDALFYAGDGIKQSIRDMPKNVRIRARAYMNFFHKESKKHWKEARKLEKETKRKLRTRRNSTF